MERVLVCPVCGQPNDLQRSFCTECRARLVADKVATREEWHELQEGRERTSSRIRRARRGLAVLLAIAVLAAGGWIGYVKLGPGRLPPAPVSNIGAVPAPGDWPMYQRGPSHAGFVPDGGPPLKGRLEWRFETNEPMLSSPAVVAGRVFLATGDGRLVALDAQTGDLIWEYELTGPVDSSPAVAGDLVIIGLRDKTVLAVNKDDGRFEWKFHTGDPVYSSPAVLDGVVYIGSGDHKVYALDAETGQKLWSYKTGEAVSSAPVVNGEVVAAMSADEHLYVIDARTGRGRFDYETTFSKTSPALYGDLVYIASETGGLRAIDWHQRMVPFEKAVRRVRMQLFIWRMGPLPPQKGLVWSYRQRGEAFVGAPAVDDRRVYAGTKSGTLAAVNRDTGEKAWSIQRDAGFAESPSVVGEMVYVGDVNGQVLAIDAETGAVRWIFRTGGRISSTPVFANGLLYVTSRDGSLYAIR